MVVWCGADRMLFVVDGVVLEEWEICSCLREVDVMYLFVTSSSSGHDAPQECQHCVKAISIALMIWQGRKVFRHFLNCSYMQLPT